VISVTALAALRLTATLTHGVPGLRARIHDGSTPVVEVRERAEGESREPVGVRVLTPRELRCAVGRAHQYQRDGRAVAMQGVAPGVDPQIDVGVPPGGEARPGGLYRVPVGAEHCWAFAMTLDATVAHVVGADLFEDAWPLVDVHALGLRRDPVTDVTLAFARTTAAPGSVTEGRLVDLLEALLARWSVHELIDDERRSAEVRVGPEGRSRTRPPRTRRDPRS
jgi:hypothetical protein